jgi:Tol biopolymer transport system component
VAFASYARNLVAGDTNGQSDIFVYDRATSQIERVSVASDGTQSNDTSWAPAISADGRYVAFVSHASNLVNGDTNGDEDVFVHDRITRQTERVSVSSSGTQGNDVSLDPAISADGRYVAFYSDADNLVSNDQSTWSDVFVRDRLTGQTTMVSVSSEGSQGIWESFGPALSADGRYVTFTSENDLAAGDQNNCMDIYVHEKLTRQRVYPWLLMEPKQTIRPSSPPFRLTGAVCRFPRGRVIWSAATLTIGWTYSSMIASRVKRHAFRLPLMVRRQSALMTNFITLLPSQGMAVT